MLNHEVRLFEKCLRRVKPNIDIEDRNKVELRRIDAGNSTAQNYCILVSDTPHYFVKIYDKRVKYLSKLQKLSIQYNFLVYPIADFSIGSKRCMVTDWLDGKIITGTQSEAFQVAEILKTIHTQKYSAKLYKLRIKLELRRYLLYLEQNKVEFKHKREIVSYLVKNSALCRKEFSLTHRDVHKRNLIKDSQDIIHLVDYENVCISDPWRDLVYACFFHEKEENKFWEMVINYYFDFNVPEDFWITMKFYCYLHLLRMILCEHQNGNYKNIERLAKSIWKNWNCYNDYLPKWKIHLELMETLGKKNYYTE